MPSCVFRASMTKISCDIRPLRAKFTAWFKIPNKVLVNKHCTVTLYKILQKNKLNVLLSRQKYGSEPANTISCKLF